MDDILTGGVGTNEATTYPVDLGDLVTTNPPTTNVPVSAVRNRAATSAILSGDPNKMVEKYRLLMQEGMEGQEVSHQQVMDALTQQERTKSMTHVINILGDKTIPLDQKERLMHVVQTNGFKTEPAVAIQTNALEQPAPGETIRGENARISLADTMTQINDEAQNRQKLLNGFIAKHPDTSIKTVGEVAETDVMPFSNNIMAAKLGAKMDEMDGKTTSLGGWVKNFLLPGSTKEDLKKKLLSIAPEKRGDYTQKLLSAIKESATVFPSEDYYAQYRQATRLLDEPTHTDGQVWAENMGTVLDAFWVGSEAHATFNQVRGAMKVPTAQYDTSKARRPGSANPGVSDAENVVEHPNNWEVVPDAHNPFAKRIGEPKKQLGYTAPKHEDAVKQIELNSVVRQENAVSPYAVVEQANPAAAKAMHEAMVSGEDEVAQAFTGMPKEQALANNIYPQVGVESGSVINKANVNPELKEALTNTGALRYTSDELDSAVAHVTNDFRSASGLQINDAMTTMRVDGDHVIIDAHYSTPGGAFTTPDGARAQAQYALRNYGIRDDEITVMKRDGMTYTPAKEKDYTIKFNKEENSFEAYDKNGDMIGDLAFHVHPSGVATVSSTSVETKYQGKGIGGDLYDHFHKHMNGKIEPSDTVSSQAWNVWLNKYPQKSIDYINKLAAESLKNIKSGKYGDEYEKVVRESTFNHDKRINKYFNEALDAKLSGKEWGGEEIKKSVRPPTKREATPAPSDYIIKVRTKHALDDGEVNAWSDLDVKRNWFDRISQTMSEDKGSISTHLFDPGSMLHPTITGSASVASDQAVTLETHLLRPIRQFRDIVNKLPHARRAMLNDYIMEANTHGLQQDRFDLIARGFNQTEIDALGKWKDIWDNHYYLENFDLVRTLNSQGYMVLDTPGTRLYAKPIPKNQNIGMVFDPATNTTRQLSKVDMDSLYNQGGHYAALRRPIDVNGQMVEHIMVRNTPTEYLRKVRETDRVLNYRHGYYTVTYKKGSKFIDQITKDPSGKDVRRTVAVAGNTKDAEMFRASQEANTGIPHVIREDSRGFAKDGDGYWDVNSASGRIAQRLRGQPLVQATGINQLGTGVYVANPLESAARAARSIAGRTVSRPVIQTAKERFIRQYGDMLPADGMGGKRFPNHMSEIVDHRSHVSKRVADARTTYQYINYLENGYINTADQIFKGGMSVLADLMGKYGLSKAENAAQYIGDLSLSHLAKSTVFNAYIVFSLPFRQWIVQSHQAMRTAAYNPIGWANGGVSQRIIQYIGHNGGLMGASEFSKFVDESGMVAGVDKNSLVRGMGLSMADSSSTFKRYAGNVMSLPQTVGFDIGEKMNQLGHLAAVHEKYAREGKDLMNKTVRDQAFAEARALSYDLNRAGELAYTQGSASALLQFLQMPHKAWLNFTNRKIATAAKLRMAGWDMLMWGAPVAAISAVVTAAGGNGGDILPNDPEHRDQFVYGMESFYMNKLFSMMDDSGDQTRIDFSALNPYGMDGWAKIYHAFVDDGAFAAMAASPVGQILAFNGVNGSKRNGRIPQAFITMGRFFNVIDELDPEHPTDFTAVLNDVAKVSSGWTTTQNAKLMFETRKKLDSVGGVVDDKVTVPEIWAATMGFGTLSTKELYEISRNRSQEKKAHEDDVKKRYRDIVTYVTNSLQQPSGSVDHTQKVMSMLMRTFDNPEDMQLVRKEWQKDMVGRDAPLFRAMFEASGMPNQQKLQDDIKMWNIDEQTKQLLLERMKDVQQLRKDNKGK